MKVMFSNQPFLKYRYFAVLLFSGAFCLSAQTTLVMQGSLQKSSGKPFDNGFHAITFKLYEVEDGGVAIWTENQPKVLVESGLYEATLGSIVPLRLPFNKRYYLGIAVNGEDELSPRAIIGNAPYAAAVTGNDNVFPTSGPVGVGTLSPDSNAYMLHLRNLSGNGTLLIEGSKRAELFLKKASNGSVGSISLDSATISVRNLDITVKNNLELPQNASIEYNGMADWRLVDRDSFTSTNHEGWICREAWNSSTSKTAATINPNTPFSKKWILRPSENGNHVLKKQFNLTGLPHKMVKVVFTYYFLDSWDADESGFAAFSTVERPSPSETGGNLQVAWFNQSPVAFSEHAFAGDPGISNRASGYTDAAVRGEMSAFHSGNSFWVIFGSNLNEVASNESYGISNIEIWVR
jgi:hypothetical protein